MFRSRAQEFAPAFSAEFVCHFGPDVQRELPSPPTRPTAQELLPRAVACVLVPDNDNRFRGGCHALRYLHFLRARQLESGSVKSTGEEDDREYELKPSVVVQRIRLPPGKG